MAKTKLVFQIILIVSFIFCLLSSALYFVIKFTFPEKLIESNINIGTLDKVEDPNEKNIFNVRYYTNKDNSGVELFEVKLNSYMNVETAKTEDPAVYSYGYQVVGTSQNSIFFAYRSEFRDGLFHANHNAYCMTYPQENSNVYHYNTQNNINFATTELKEKDNIFKISINGDIYGLMFKGEQSENILEKQTLAPWAVDTYYAIYDMNHLANLLLKSVKSISSGTEGIVTMKLSDDIFNFYKFENGSFKQFSKNDNASLVTQIVDTFISCKFEIFDTGAKVAKDSMFNIIEKRSDYSIIEEDSVYDYKIGEAPIILTEYDFKYALIDGSYNVYRVLLKESTIEYLRTTNVKFDIKLNFFNLEDNNIVIYGFDANSGLEEFKDRINSIKINKNNAELEVDYNDEQFY